MTAAAYFWLALMIAFIVVEASTVSVVSVWFAAGALAGTIGTALEEIDNNAATGRVKLGAMEWSARSTDDVVIPAGTLIRADKVEGIKE